MATVNVLMILKLQAVFWRNIWESSGTGNKDANWMKDIKEAIASRVPPPSEEECDLDPTIAVKIMRKKRNFNAPGPDRFVSFWWKRATSLHNEVTQAFMAISNRWRIPPGV